MAPGADASRAYDRLPVEGFQPTWSERVDTGGEAPDERHKLPPHRTIRVKTAEGLSFEAPRSQQDKIAIAIVRGHGLKLKACRLVTVKFSKGEELWFAENEKLDIYAEGETREKALREFQLLLTHYFKYYKELDRSRGMGEALRLKSLFEENFDEVPR
jgi:hypothetical protein